MNTFKNLIKRVFDFLVALVGLLVVTPLLLTLIVILALSNNGKPFFHQLRAGENGKIVTIIKLKTMNNLNDNEEDLLPVIERITKVGDFCRKYSLDEIPQLLNILKGDMSLVGHRPLLPNYLELHNE